jgi:hypothetical protein
MTLALTWHCDACPTTVTRWVGEPNCLLTPDGWTALGTWETGYLHGCRPECAQLLSETRGYRVVRRPAWLGDAPQSPVRARETPRTARVASEATDAAP